MTDTLERNPKLDALTLADLRQIRELTIQYRLDFEDEHGEFLKALTPEQIADVFVAGVEAEAGIRARHNRGEITTDQAAAELTLLMYGSRGILEATIKDCERRIAALS